MVVGPDKGGHGGGGTGGEGPKPPAGPKRARAFVGSVDVSAAAAKVNLVTIVEEVISLLASDPNAAVRVTLEIAVDLPSGASDAIRWAVGENATVLGFKTKEWE